MAPPLMRQPPRLRLLGLGCVGYVLSCGSALTLLSGKTVQDNARPDSEAEEISESYRNTRWHAAVAEEYDRTGKLPFMWDAVSGTASGFNATAALREFLPGWLRAHGVTSMVEASSGHWPSGWQRNVSWPRLDYTGVDIQPEVIAANRRLTDRYGNFGMAGVRFLEWDMLKDPLPSADLLFVKDTLVHFPDAKVMEFLNKSVTVCPRRFRYVMFVNPVGRYKKGHPSRHNNGHLEPIFIGCSGSGASSTCYSNVTDEVYSGVRAIDMEREPFNLPVETVLEYMPEYHKVQVYQPPQC